METSSIGILGGLVSTFGMLPQIKKMVDTKRTEDISWGMIMMWYIGGILLFIYGSLIGEVPLLIIYGISLLFITILSTIKYYYDNIKMI